MISGIQHYYYCKRQWFLIHVEQLWEDNIYTVRGDVLHEKVDNPFILESRKDRFISRSVPIVSYSLGFYGVSDAVEFMVDSEGYYIESKKNYFKVIPVEYKSGKPKKDNCDAVQLCTQAMCLEEMLDIKINHGFLYYGKTRHRQRIELDLTLREEVLELSKAMHQIINNDRIIQPDYCKKCERCSLKNLCIPKTKTHYKSVKNYIKAKLNDKEDLYA
ncbi:CRISPR-associated protein Cas4 [Alkaliphilus pronyensis]|nr:CRISPR-associated protein Cas4 [Alkaliphilus pronyensis]